MIITEIIVTDEGVVGEAGDEGDAGDADYLSIISMGAIGTWRLFDKQNDLFAAAMTVAGTTILKI